ncbi:MAG TPA: tetratricopeptide repeat-containing protein [Gemmataceae bacterium]|nr:tetratricopeptide repeat-containing protein [Gemmataceae bacterium]
MPTAKELLDRFTIDYDVLLERARRWRISNVPEQAVELLRGLQGRYPLALEIGQELVLALIDANKRDEAQVEMHKLQSQLRNPNEELLSRWGRLFKEDGDRLNPHLPDELKGRSTDDRRPNDAELADRFYADSQQKYNQAYQVRLGHYPGINKATLLLVRASLASAMQDSERARAFVNQAQRLAGELLERRRRNDWPDDQPDDHKVWHPATEAEALLLLREWKRAADLYRSIPMTAGHRSSIVKQIERILAAWDQLGAKKRDECQSIETIFPKQEGDSAH